MRKFWRVQGRLPAAEFCLLSFTSCCPSDFYHEFAHALPEVHCGPLETSPRAPKGHNYHKSPKDNLFVNLNQCIFTSLFQASCPVAASSRGARRFIAPRQKRLCNLVWKAPKEGGCARIPLSPSLAYQGQSPETVQGPSGLCGWGQALGECRLEDG